jgi:hypothetical protein
MTDARQQMTLDGILHVINAQSALRLAVAPCYRESTNRKAKKVDRAQQVPACARTLLHSRRTWECRSKPKPPDRDKRGDSKARTRADEPPKLEWLAGRYTATKPWEALSIPARMRTPPGNPRRL